MATYNGVIVYEILPNGCLNGVYSNTHPSSKNEIYNEIARKKLSDNSHKTEKNIDEIEGFYNCSYIDLLSEAFICDLEIKNNNGRYDFIWFEKGTKKIKFRGTGWRTRKDQITVQYSD